MRITALCLSLLTLAGCATGPQLTAVDEGYVAKVEAGAKLGGAQVVWVHMPTRPTTPAEQQQVPNS